MGRAADSNAWTLTNSSGTLEFISTTNGSYTPLVSASFSPSTTNWMQIVLTYSSTGSFLYTNGVQANVTAGSGVSGNYPGPADRALGMVIGNNTSGNSPANAQFDEIETFNHALSAGQISSNFQAVSAFDASLDGVPDIIQDINLSASQPFLGAPVTVTGTIEAEQFDRGGTNAYYAVGGTVYTNYRTSKLLISPCGDMPFGATNGAAGYCLDQTKASEWVRYTINVLVSNQYTIDTRVAGIAAGGGTFGFSFTNINTGANTILTNPPLTIPGTQWSDVLDQCHIGKGNQCYDALPFG